MAPGAGAPRMPAIPHTELVSSSAEWKRYDRSHMDATSAGVGLRMRLRDLLRRLLPTSSYNLLRRLRGMNPYRMARYFLWSASLIGLSRGPHITRYFMYGRLQSLGSRLPNRNGRTLCISQSTNLVELMGLRPIETITADYPTHNILSLGFPDASFDWVLSDQVLEHVEGNPQTAIDECRRVLRSG